MISSRAGTSRVFVQALRPLLNRQGNLLTGAENLPWLRWESVALGDEVTPGPCDRPERPPRGENARKTEKERLSSGAGVAPKSGFSIYVIFYGRFV